MWPDPKTHPKLNKAPKEQARPEPAAREELAGEAGSRGKSQQDPLHGVTLEQILIFLHQKYGWDELGRRIRINCFTQDPSIASSLKFLRRIPWARQKVEDLYRLAVRHKSGDV